MPISKNERNSAIFVVNHATKMKTISNILFKSKDHNQRMIDNSDIKIQVTYFNGVSAYDILRPYHARIQRCWRYKICDGRTDRQAESTTLHQLFFKMGGGGGGG